MRTPANYLAAVFGEWIGQARQPVIDFDKPAGSLKKRAMHKLHTAETRLHLCLHEKTDRVSPICFNSWDLRYRHPSQNLADLGLDACKQSLDGQNNHFGMQRTCSDRHGNIHPVRRLPSIAKHPAFTLPQRDTLPVLVRPYVSGLCLSVDQPEPHIPWPIRGYSIMLGTRLQPTTWLEK